MHELKHRGVVLAGGKATRLPNKALLPLKNLKPAITSGIDLLLRSMITDITVVVPPNSSIPRILHALGYSIPGLHFVEQAEPLGVPMAISQILPEINLLFDDRVIVTYCDNVYDGLICIEDDIPIIGHTVMTINNPVKTKSLSRYDNGQWIREGQSHLYIAGYMLLNREAIQQAHHFQSTEMLLNYFSGTPIKIEDNNWWDIGTVETYNEYWKEIS